MAAVTRLALLFCAGLLLVPAPASAQTPPNGSASRQAHELSAEIMSPFCPGLTLAACPSGAAADLREEIALRFSRGETRDAIVENLVARFGEVVRAVPRPEGIGLTLWLWPLVLALLMSSAVMAAGSGLTRRRGLTDRRVLAPLPDLADPALSRRLDDELRDLD